MFNGMGTNSIPLTLIIVGLFYAIFGIFKLGVTLDIGLLIGTLTLLVYIIDYQNVKSFSGNPIYIQNHYCPTKIGRVK